MDTELDQFKGVHAPGMIDFTLCGLSLDAFQTGDAAEPVIEAKPGEQITCKTCRANIDHIRRNFKLYRYTGAVA
ncbi:hypothetical protein [Paucibacter soli]|uniref:hypothetical protein n=1 Tax=Paucibacter soli TaxID=3133433 RepID=UPI0030ADCB60